MTTKSISKISLSYNSQKDGVDMIVDVIHTTRGEFTLSADFSFERPTRVTFSGDLLFLKKKHFRNGILIKNMMGVDYLFMFMVPCGDEYVATGMPVVSKHDRKHILDEKVEYIDEYCRNDTVGYSFVTVGNVIQVIPRPIQDISVKTQEMVFFSSVHLIQSLLDTCSLSLDMLFNPITCEDLQYAGNISKIIKKSRGPNGGGYPPALAKRKIGELFTADKNKIYSINFVNPLTYYINYEIADRENCVYEDINVVVSNDELKEISLSNECGGTVYYEDEYVYDYFEAYNDNRPRCPINKNFLYSVESRQEMLADFFFVNRENYLTDASGKCSTKLFEFFLKKEDCCILKKDQRCGEYYELDPLFLNILSSCGRDGYDVFRKSNVVYKVAYALYDFEGREYWIATTNNLLVVEPRVVNTSQGRQFKYSVDISYSENSVGNISMLTYGKISYISFILLIDDGNYSNDYDLQVTNLRTMTDHVFKIGLHSLCYVSKDTKYLVNNNWVVWNGSVICDDVTLENFVQQRGFYTLKSYHNCLAYVSEFIHKYLSSCFKGNNETNISLVLDLDILKKYREKGERYGNILKVRYKKETPYGRSYLELYE